MNLTRKDGADAALKLLIAARGTLYNIDANDIALKVTEAIESIQAEFWPEQLHPSVYVGEGAAGREKPYPQSWKAPKMGPETLDDPQGLYAASGGDTSVCEFCEEPLGDGRPWKRGLDGAGAHLSCLRPYMDDDETNEAREADKDDLHPITRGEM